MILALVVVVVLAFVAVRIVRRRHSAKEADPVIEGPQISFTVTRDPDPDSEII